MTIQQRTMYRIGVGKALGLVFGLLGFFFLPFFIQQPSELLRWGILLWYPTMGALIGIFGLFARHPMFNFSMPWWFRGAVLGAWMNFVLALFAYQQICILITALFGEYASYVSPFTMVLEGAFIGLLIDYLLTRWFGEGWLDE